LWTLTTGKLIGTIADTHRRSRCAIAPEFKHGFTSNGRENKSRCSTPTTLQLINKIDVGKDQTESITIREPNASLPTIMARTTSPRSTQKQDSSSVRSRLKATRISSHRRWSGIRSNIEDTNEVVAFDPKSLEVKKRFPIGVAKTPTGLAYDARRNGCLSLPQRSEDGRHGCRLRKSDCQLSIGRGVDYAALIRRRTSSSFHAVKES